MTFFSEVKKWYEKNKDKAVFMHADPDKFNPEHFVNTNDMNELAKIIMKKRKA